MRASPKRAFALVAALALASTSAAADDRIIRYGDDALTVKVSKATRTEVLDEVVKQSGAELRGQLRNGDADVTAEFERVPLPEALHRLLGDQNFTLVYGHGGALHAIRLLGGPLAAPASGAVRAPVAAGGTPAAPPGDLAALVAKHAPIPIAGHLGEALGGSTATIPQLLDVGVHHEDVTVRAEALRAVISTLEVDPALRAAVVGQLNAMDDTALSSLLRGAAGDHAEEVAMQVLTTARASEIRVKASSVLQKLRAGG